MGRVSIFGPPVTRIQGWLDATSVKLFARAKRRLALLLGKQYTDVPDSAVVAFVLRGEETSKKELGL